MSNRTNLRNFFERSVMGTVRLISKQVTQVENVAADGEIPYQITVHPRCLRIFFQFLGRELISHLKNIFLAGGLSTNPYLFNEVKNWANSRGGIQVQKAEDWFVDRPVKNV